MTNMKGIANGIKILLKNGAPIEISRFNNVLNKIGENVPIKTLKDIQINNKLFTLNEYSLLITRT